MLVAALTLFGCNRHSSRPEPWVWPGANRCNTRAFAQSVTRPLPNWRYVEAWEAEWFDVSATEPIPANAHVEHRPLLVDPDRDGRLETVTSPLCRPPAAVLKWEGAPLSGQSRGGLGWDQIQSDSARIVADDSVGWMLLPESVLSRSGVLRLRRQPDKDAACVQQKRKSVCHSPQHGSVGLGNYRVGAELAAGLPDAEYQGLAEIGTRENLAECAHVLHGVGPGSTGVCQLARVEKDGAPVVAEPGKQRRLQSGAAAVEHEAGAAAEQFLRGRGESARGRVPGRRPGGRLRREGALNTPLAVEVALHLNLNRPGELVVPGRAALPRILDDRLDSPAHGVVAGHQFLYQAVGVDPDALDDLKQVALGDDGGSPLGHLPRQVAVGVARVDHAGASRPDRPS